MFDIVDILLLLRGVPADDGLPTFRRVDGNPTSKVIHFLPWHPPINIARAAGFLPLDFSLLAKCRHGCDAAAVQIGA